MTDSIRQFCRHCQVVTCVPPRQRCCHMQRCLTPPWALGRQAAGPWPWTSPLGWAPIGMLRGRGCAAGQLRGWHGRSRRPPYEDGMPRRPCLQGRCQSSPASPAVEPCWEGRLLVASSNPRRGVGPRHPPPRRPCSSPASLACIAHPMCRCRGGWKRCFDPRCIHPLDQLGLTASYRQWMSLPLAGCRCTA